MKTNNLKYTETPSVFHVHGECTKKVFYKLLDYIDDMKIRGWYFTTHERNDLESGNVEIDYKLELTEVHAKQLKFIQKTQL
jgi:hypothetical protein